MLHRLAPVPSARLLTPRLVPVFVVLAAAASGILVGSGCTDQPSCADDNDCFRGQICQKDRCVSVDATSAPDTDMPTDAGRDIDPAADTSSPDTSRPDTRSEDTSSEDTSDPCTGDAVSAGCPCQYKGKSSGVCASSTTDIQGNCRRPEAYVDDETRADHCDGKDNDCDGQTDENLSRSCYTGPSGTAGTGVCRKGIETCNGGSWGSCEGEKTPSEEACNRKDDDCDGEVDEELSGGPKQGGASCVSNCECRSRCTSSGTCAHRVFVTADRRRGRIQNPDQVCNNKAGQANIGGTWKALLTIGGNSAKSRISVTAPIDNTCNSGQPVARKATKLWNGGIANAIKCDANGKAVSMFFAVWTGTQVDGTKGNFQCSQWSDNTDGSEGLIGRADKNNGSWIRWKASGCSRRARLYCIDGQ